MQVLVHTIHNYRNFKYVVEVINPGSNNLELFSEIRTWLFDNHIANQEHAIEAIWYLERRDDLTLFMLRWA